MARLRPGSSPVDRSSLQAVADTSALEEGSSSHWRETPRTVHVAGRPVVLLVPDKRDPRFIEIAVLIVAALFRAFIAHQPLTVPQVLAAIAVPVLLDLPITFVRRRVLITPASPLITGLIIALILQSRDVWPFAAAGAIAVLSKHLIRTRQRQVFNPAALGLAVVLLAFSSVVHVSPEEWKTSAVVFVVVIAAGTFAVRMSGMSAGVPFFALPYTIILILGLLIQHHGHLDLVATRTALVVARTSFAIFMVYLLSEPRTAPRVTNGKRVYAVITAVLGSVLFFVGVDRMVALLLALLVANAAGLFVLDRLFTDEPPPKTTRGFGRLRLRRRASAPEDGSVRTHTEAGLEERAPVQEVP